MPEFTEKWRPKIVPRASLRSRHAHGHVTRATLCENLQEKSRGTDGAPWSSTGLNSCRKNPSVWRRSVWGKNALQYKQRPARGWWRKMRSHRGEGKVLPIGFAVMFQRQGSLHVVFQLTFCARHRCWVTAALDNALAVRNPVSVDILSVDVAFTRHLFLGHLLPLLSLVPTCSLDISFSWLPFSWYAFFFKPLSLETAFFWNLFPVPLDSSVRHYRCLDTTFFWPGFLLASLDLDKSFSWCLFLLTARHIW